MRAEGGSYVCEDCVNLIQPRYSKERASIDRLGGRLFRMRFKEPIQCCQTWEVHDEDLHCVHVHFFSGERSVRHRNCCTHSQCVKMRGDE